MVVRTVPVVRSEGVASVTEAEKNLDVIASVLGKSLSGLCFVDDSAFSPYSEAKSGSCTHSSRLLLGALNAPLLPSLAVSGSLAWMGRACLLLSPPMADSVQEEVLCAGAFDGE